MHRLGGKPFRFLVGIASVIRAGQTARVASRGPWVHLRRSRRSRCARSRIRVKVATFTVADDGCLWPPQL